MSQLAVWIYQRPGSPMWYIGWRENGHQKAKSCKTTDEAQAELLRRRKADEIRHRSNDEPVLEMAWVDVISAYEKEVINKPKTIVSNRDSWRKAPYKVLGDVTRANHVTWIKKLNESFSPATVSIHLRNANKLIRFAIDKGWLHKSPYKRGDIPERVIVARFYTAEEKAAILKDASHSPEFQSILCVILETGLRISQAIELDWSQYNKSTGVLTIPPQKRQKIRLVPASPKALVAMGEAKDEGRIFPGWTVNKAEKKWQRLVKRLTKKGKIKGRCRLHDLRHTHASEAANVLRPHELKDYFGWSTVAMTDTYAHTRTEEIHAKLKTLY